jgi:hypothetical protein
VALVSCLSPDIVETRVTASNSDSITVELPTFHHSKLRLSVNTLRAAH